MRETITYRSPIQMFRTPTWNQTAYDMAVVKLKGFFYRQIKKNPMEDSFTRPAHRSWTKWGSKTSIRGVTMTWDRTTDEIRGGFKLTFLYQGWRSAPDVPIVEVLVTPDNIWIRTSDGGEGKGAFTVRNRIQEYIPRVLSADLLGLAMQNRWDKDLNLYRFNSEYLDLTQLYTLKSVWRYWYGSRSNFAIKHNGFDYTYHSRSFSNAEAAQEFVLSGKTEYTRRAIRSPLNYGTGVTVGGVFAPHNDDDGEKLLLEEIGTIKKKFAGKRWRRHMGGLCDSFKWKLSWKQANLMGNEWCTQFNEKFDPDYYEKHKNAPRVLVCYYLPNSPVALLEAASAQEAVAI